jgi:excisionase family DNA binding protein
VERIQDAPVFLNMISPVMSQEMYASFLGITKDTVRGWIEQGTVPSVKIGRQRFVNVKRVVSDLEEGKTIFTRGDYED